MEEILKKFLWKKFNGNNFYGKNLMEIISMEKI